jgi:intracellular septation protein A
MNWRDVYSSKKRFFTTVGKWYLITLVILIPNVTMYNKFKQSGYIMIRTVVVNGNDALYFIGSSFFVCLITFIYASFIGMYGLWYFKTSSAKKVDLTPENWICIKCRTTFAGYSVNNCSCPKCGHDLEDLEGFYERHPQLKKRK